MVSPKPQHPKPYRRNTFIYPTFREVCSGVALAAILFIGSNYAAGNIAF